MSAERQVEAKAVAATAVDSIQQVVAEELKGAIRRGTVDRETAKRGIGFLGQAMGRSLLRKLRDAHQAWSGSSDDDALVTKIAGLAKEFGKQRPRNGPGPQLKQEDLELICFEYVCGG